MKCIIYTRVSSDEQVQGTSLDSQEEACRKYSASKGLEVLEVFREEGVSAKSTERPMFLRAIEYCRKNKNRIVAFVVAKVDRFARNTEDHFMVRKVLLDYGVTLHSVSEPIGNNPTEKLLETVLAGAADFDNAIRKQRCSDGMRAKINQGLYPWKPPIGYKCHHFKKQGLKKNAPDSPDVVIFPIIQKGLQEMALGMHSKIELTRRLDELGLAKARGKKTVPQSVDKMLEWQRLRFYAGWIYNPWEKLYVKGLHIPMITDEEAKRIKDILDGKARPTSRNRNNPEFPLRRTVLCSKCKNPLTGSTPRGNGGKYSYYHCHNRRCGMFGKSMRKADVENAFIAYLNKITPKLEWLSLFKGTVIDLWKEKAKLFELDVGVAEKRLKALEAKRKRIFEMREDGSYNQDEFIERKEEVENEIVVAKIALDEARIEQFDIETAVSYATAFISDLGRQWFDLSPKLRPRFQKLVFPEGVWYDKENGIGTTKLGLIYTLIEERHPLKPTLVDHTGFEPVTSSLPARRSTK